MNLARKEINNNYNNYSIVINIMINTLINITFMGK